MKSKCKWCGKKIDPRGMPSHWHFRHADLIVRSFFLQPVVMLWRWIFDGVPPRFEQKQLPAPNPLTVYSTKPLGKMAASIPEHRRPKGYTLDRNYARPSDALPTKRFFWQ